MHLKIILRLLKINLIDFSQVFTIRGLSRKEWTALHLSAIKSSIAVIHAPGMGRLVRPKPGRS
jgi:hypothetical protein